MNDQQPEAVTVELVIKLTHKQISLWRQAISRASTESDAKHAGKHFFRSIRATGNRYVVRELGRVEPKAHQQTDRRHHGYNGAI